MDQADSSAEIREVSSPAAENSPPIFARRFSVKQIMVHTAVASLFLAALLQENEWWLATLVTVTIGVIFNELLAAILGQGMRRAFGLGHSLAAALLPLSAYVGPLTLPFLLTREAMELIQSLRSINENHFTIVAFIFWMHVSCRSSGYLAMFWYRAALEKR